MPVIDAVLAVVVVAVVVHTLTTADERRSVRSYVVFAVVLAGVSMRLGAPGIAVLEAVIAGAATGGLLWWAVRVGAPARPEPPDVP